MVIDFKNDTVFITGASRGIGKTIASQFEQDGAKVIAPKRSELDLSDSKMVDAYLAEYPNTDANIFIFCAGVNYKNPIEKTSYEELLRTYQVNVFSSMQIIKQYTEHIRQCENGKILFITSLYANVTKEGRSPYTGSKHAVAGLMKTLALEFAPYHVCVNAVAPGYVMTDMTRKNLSEKDIEDICKLIPMGQFQSTEDVSYMVEVLCSRHNCNITGQMVNVDGGFLCR